MAMEEEINNASKSLVKPDNMFSEIISLNLYELLYLNALSRRMCSTLPDMKTVDQKIRQIKALPKYGPIPSMLIYALISSSFTIFFRGSG